MEKTETESGNGNGKRKRKQKAEMETENGNGKRKIGHEMEALACMVALQVNKAGRQHSSSGSQQQSLLSHPPL